MRRKNRLLATVVAASLISGTVAAPAEAQTPQLSSNVAIEQLLSPQLRNNPALLAFGALSGLGLLAGLIALLSGNTGSSDGTSQPGATPVPTSTPTTTPTTAMKPSTTTTAAPTTTPTLTTKPSTTTTAAPGATPTVTVTPATGLAADPTAAVNSFRSSLNAPALTTDAQLQQLAQSYAQRAADAGSLIKPTENVGGYYTQQAAGVTAAGVMEFGKASNNLSGISVTDMKKIGVGTVEKDGKVWIYVLTGF